MIRRRASGHPDDIASVDQVQLDKPPWSATRGPVSWHIHGPARPTYGNAATSPAGASR